MGARITELVLRRESALSLLKRAPHDSYVMAAIEVLENETAPGQPGGRAREFHENVGFLPASKDRVKKLPLRAQSGAVEGFTERGQEIVACIASGMTNDEIAATLYLSVDTVKTHLSRMLHQFKLRNRVELVTYARERGVV